jgi:hypothetical protein
VSLRHRVSRVAVVVTALALVFGVVAGTASARTLSRHQRSVVRHQLLRAIKKNPKLIRKASFLKKASLVDFKLPVVIRLRDRVACGVAGEPACPAGSTFTDPASGQSAFDPNSANVDLGTSLGTRSISLGGTLPAEIQFHDSFDGGGLGNVDLRILRDTTGATGLTSSSIPLLWNTQVSGSGTHWFLSGGNAAAGCGDFVNSGATAPFSDPSVGPTAAGFTHPTLVTPDTGLPYNTSPAGPLPAANGGGSGFAFGVPYIAAAGPLFGLVGEYPGVDDIGNVQAGTPGEPLPSGTTVNDLVGTNPNPFPTGVAPVGGGNPSPAGPGPLAAGYGNAADSVLRTGALKLNVAQAGPDTDATGNNLNVGPSGGQANLFGNIPGKTTQVDVTVSLETQINSILREVDPDPQILQAGHAWTAQSFVCRQAWTGSVRNLITGVHLIGTLRISPAIDRDGSLRIAKTILTGDTNHPTRIGLAACLFPYMTYALPTGGTQAAGSNPASVPVPVDPLQEATPTVPGYAQDSTSPLQGVGCNAPPSHEVAAANVSALNTPPNPPYTTSANGSQAQVAGDLTINKIDAEVLIGGNVSSSNN